MQDLAHKFAKLLVNFVLGIVTTYIVCAKAILSLAELQNPCHLSTNIGLVTSPVSILDWFRNKTVITMVHYGISEITISIMVE